MGWRDVLRKYGPAILTAVLDAGKTDRMPRPVTEPEVIIPPPTVPVQPVPTPAPVPVQPVPTVQVDDETRKEVVRTLYKEYLNRSRSDITNAEMDEAVDLLRAGREDELRRNLKARQ